jgi:hypothetical protein
VYYKKGPFDCGKPDTVTTGIEYPDGVENHLSVYPNPTSDILFLELPGVNNRIQTIELFNARGQLAGIYSQFTSPVFISMKEFEKGLYLVKVNTVEGTSFTRKIIRN